MYTSVYTQNSVEVVKSACYSLYSSNTTGLDLREGRWSDLRAPRVGGLFIPREKVIPRAPFLQSSQLAAMDTEVIKD